MKHGSNVRRGRSRNNNPNRRQGPSRNSNFESNGPNVKIRGTAQQVQEKYIALARDASSAGDRILAEGYLQFAEHYYRIASAAEQQNGGQQQNRPNSPQSFDDRGEGNPDDGTSDDGDEQGDEAEVIVAAPARPAADGDDAQGDDDGDDGDDDRGNRAGRGGEQGDQSAASGEDTAPRRPRRRSGPRNRPQRSDGDAGGDAAPEAVGA